MNRTVLVSIHDVWPGNQAGVERDLEWLRARGVSSAALMVVPFYHGKRSLDQESAFQSWLKEKQNQGAEIFMHGYRHRTPESLGENAQRTWAGRWLNSVVRNEAEFAGLAAEQSKYLLGNALQIFSLSGIVPVGFTVPTWWGEIPAGFKWPEACRFFDGRFHVWGRVKGKRLWAPALTFGRNENGKADIYGGGLWQAYLRQSSLMRIALHPGDLAFSNIQRAVTATLENREVVAYAGIL